MRKRFLSLLMVLFCVSANAQSYFTLTQDGYRNVSDQDKKYIIHRFSNISKEEISKRVVQWISYSLNNFNPNIDLFSQDNHTILLKKSITHFLNKGIAAMTLDYQISFFITDNAIRINAPTSYLLGTASGSEIFIGIKGKNWAGRHFYIYDTDGKLLESEYKKTLEDYFNSLFKNIIQAISTNPNVEWETE